MTTPITLGLIGAGRIGRVHAESIMRRLSGATLAAVADPFGDAAQRCAADFDIPAAYQDHRALLADPAIDAVVICSSTDTHTRFIMEAAEAGKHIFCEKPIALDRGEIGTPHLLRITSRDPAPPPISYIKVSGGIFLDMTIHDFDMARYLIGSEVTEVYASGAVLVDPAIGEAGDIDTAVITLRFANGALGIIDNSRQAVYGYDQRAEVFGSAGAIEAQNKTAQNTRHSTAAGVQAAKPLYFFLERYIDAYVAEMRAFIEAIQNDTTPLVTGLDGRAPVAIGLAAWRSYREKRPVQLDEF